MEYSISSSSFGLTPEGGSPGTVKIRHYGRNFTVKVVNVIKLKLLSCKRGRQEIPYIKVTAKNPKGGSPKNIVRIINAQDFKGQKAVIDVFYTEYEALKGEDSVRRPNYIEPNDEFEFPISS